nr:MAG TPA: hypothetical protein [Bacteriophage sp.]
MGCSCKLFVFSVVALNDRTLNFLKYFYYIFTIF